MISILLLCSIFKTTMNTITKLQKRATRNKTSYCDHTNPLFVKCHVMKLKDIVQHKIMQMMFRAYKKTLQTCVQSFFFFSIHKSIYNLRDVLSLFYIKQRNRLKRDVLLLSGFGYGICKDIFESYKCD